MFKEEVFDEIFKEEPSGEKYYIIDNGYKVWIIPEKNMAKGYGIYQVSSLKGWLMKNVFPLLRKIHLIRKIAKCEIKNLVLSEDIQKVISKYYDKSYCCSVYYGNLDAEQNCKATMQVYAGEKIVCFIKITNNVIVKEAIDREASCLNELHKYQIENIPYPMGIDNVGEWKFFAQSTGNTKHKSKFTLRQCHWNFLEKLYNKSQKAMTYEESDIYTYINYLKKQINIDENAKEKDILREGIRRVESWLKTGEHVYSMAHGDFTPWNMYCDGDDLYVYDFEYCLTSTIPFMDFFHFICQVEIISNGMNENKVVEEYEKNKEKLRNFTDNTDMAFISYLLYIVSFYLMRKNGKFDIHSGQFQFRIRLLNKIIKKEV